MTDKILDRVRKLLAKASDPSVTEAEATLFAEKARSILAERGLSMTDVPEEERDDHVTQETWTPKYAENGWRKILSQWVARLYFCDMIQTREWVKKPDGTYLFRRGRPVRRTGYILVGRPHNIAVAREMTEYLFSTIVRLAGQYRRETGVSHAERCEFERGCADRVTDRVREMWLRNQPRKNSSVGSGGLPALYENESDLVERYKTEKMNVRSIKIRSGSLSGAHAHNGRVAGDSVSLNPQVRGSGRSGRLLS